MPHTRLKILCSTSTLSERYVDRNYLYFVIITIPSQGTRKYIARRVQQGEDETQSLMARDHCFPTLTSTAYDQYVAAYGEDTYQEYTETFNNIERYKVKRDGVEFLHRPHHDMESVIWVLVDGLVHAWPIDAEPEVEQLANLVMHMFQTHAIIRWLDTRVHTTIKEFREVEWVEILNPKLRFLTTMMVQLSNFLHCDWTVWMHPKDKKPLKADFLHEALKRILLQEIVFMDEETNDGIALYDTSR
jgi:hypothetical protein